MAGGCRPAPPPQVVDADTAYANAYKAVMVEYRDRVKEVAAEPLPDPKAGISRQERRRRIAENVQRMADVYQACLDRLKALQPTPAYAEAHAASLALLEAGATSNAKWAAAIRTGNRKAADAASAELEEKTKKALLQMKRANDNLGLNTPQLDAALREVGLGDEH
jgi:ATP-dependent exoDNAse (exonuclease V) alpha subunit